MSIEKHRATWEPFQAADGHIYVFPQVRIIRPLWRGNNAVVRLACQVECDCVTVEYAHRDFFYAFHDAVFDSGQLDERDYERQSEIARGYVMEYLETTSPQPCFGLCDVPIWGDCEFLE